MTEREERATADGAPARKGRRTQRWTQRCVQRSRQQGPPNVLCAGVYARTHARAPVRTLVQRGSRVRAPGRVPLRSPSIVRLPERVRDHARCILGTMPFIIRRRTFIRATPLRISGRHEHRPATHERSSGLRATFERPREKGQALLEAQVAFGGEHQSRRAPLLEPKAPLNKKPILLMFVCSQARAHRHFTSNRHSDTEAMSALK
eukprot:2893332-Pleurochrysis_carterae.AAC.3